MSTRRLEDDAGGLGVAGGSGAAGQRVDEVIRRAEDEADRAVELRELDDFRLLRADREDDDLLLAVEGRVGLRRLAARGRLLATAVDVSGGGSSVPSTCIPWRMSLVLVLFRPLTTVIELSAGLIVMTGNLSPVRPMTMST